MVTSHPLILVIALNFTVAGLMWLGLPSSIRHGRSDDYQHSYEPVARRLVQGKGLTMPDGTPAIRYPPGHSLALAGIFWLSDRLQVPETWTLVLFPLAMHALSGVMVFSAARGVFGSSVAWVAALLWSVYVPALYVGLLLNSETGFVPILLSAILLGWRSSDGNKARQFASGALLGIAMLIRPIAVGLPLVLGGWCLSFCDIPWRSRLAQAGILLLSTTTIVAPWQWWMRTQVGDTHVLSSGGLPSVIDGLTFCRASQARVQVSVPEDVRVLAADLHLKYSAGEIPDFSSLALWLRRQAGARPLALSKLLVTKAGRSWYGTDSHRFERELFLLQAPFLAGAAIGGWICLRRPDTARRFAILSLLVVGYFWLMTIAVLSIVRYMVPVMPFVIILCAVAIHHCWLGLCSLGRAANRCPQ